MKNFFFLEDIDVEETLAEVAGEVIIEVSAVIEENKGKRVDLV